MSPRLTLDLSEAQSLKPIPDDTYPMRVDVVTGPHEGPKANYLTAELIITEGEYEGRKFYNNLPVHGKGAGIFADFISKCTGEEIDVDDLDELDIDTDDLVGAEVLGVVKQEEYPEGSGEMRSQLKKVLAA